MKDQEQLVLPLWEAGSRRRADGRLMRVPSPGLPLGEAGFRRGADRRLMRVISAINVLRQINKVTHPRFADPPSRDGYPLGFPRGKLAPATKWTGD